MKYLVVAISVLFSMSLIAQTKGVGPAVDTGAPEPSKTPKLFEKLEEKLHKREIICGSKKKGQPKDKLIDTYYRLTFAKVSDKCKITSKIYKCINNWDVKNLINDIAQSPNSIEYIMSSYQIERKSAQEVLKFFENLDNADPEL
jgi:hypothetical protein